MTFNPRSFSVFRHFRQWSGGGGKPPGVSKLRVVKLREKKTADSSRRVLAIGGAIFYPRSKFHPVLGGKRSNFREIGTFSTLL